MPLPSYSTAAKSTISSVLVHEAPFQMSREPVTVLAGVGTTRTLLLGTVYGHCLFGDPVILPDGGNTGDGALGSLVYGSSIKAGDYVLTCVSATSDAGMFQVLDPDGYRLGDVTVGAAYNNLQLGFLVSDGSADFVVGDAFTITVAVGDEKIVQLDPAATDGTQLAAGFLIAGAAALDGVDALTTSINRDALAADAGLVWPEGISAPDKAAALVRMASRNIQVRTAV